MNDRVVPGRAGQLRNPGGRVYPYQENLRQLPGQRLHRGPAGVPHPASQAVIDRALSVRGGQAELLQAYIDVEPASYNRGFYSVDIRYYYRITAEAFVGGSVRRRSAGWRSLTSGCSSLAARATPRSSPPASGPRQGTARAWGGATSLRRW